jgi:hypothetical protein
MSGLVPENARFVCFGCLSNVGPLTGLAGIEVVREVRPRTASIFLQDRGLKKEPPLEYGDEELQVAKAAILDAVQGDGQLKNDCPWRKDRHRGYGWCLPLWTYAAF